MLRSYIPPEGGGTFGIAQFLSPQLAAFLDGWPEALADPLVAAAAASRLRSCQMATSLEYAATVARLYKARMAVFSAQKAEFPLGLFAIPKSSGNLRLCAELLAMKFGIEVSPELVDADGWTHPQLAPCPMGWKPAPALAQAGNESVLYGADCRGSELARAMPPVLRPTERLSSTRTPKLASSANLRCHSIIIDDLINFKTVPSGLRVGGGDLVRGCRRGMSAI